MAAARSCLNAYAADGTSGTTKLDDEQVVVNFLEKFERRQTERMQSVAASKDS